MRTGGGHLEPSTHMAEVTLPKEKRVAGYALASGEVFLFNIGKGWWNRTEGIKGLHVDGDRDVKGYTETPRKGLLKIFGPKKEPIYGDVGKLLVTYTVIDNKERLTICQRDSKLKEICKNVLSDSGRDKSVVSVSRGLYDNDCRNFFVF